MADGWADGNGRHGFSLRDDSAWGLCFIEYCIHADGPRGGRVGRKVQDPYGSGLALGAESET
jgi:hypothetical protein